MKVKIYRGTKEIGGNCIQVTANNGKILWIDIGAPLSQVNPDVSYATNKVDALLISHPHQDHFGLMGVVGENVPVYMGQVTHDLINATKIFMGKPPSAGNTKIFEPWKEFVIADTFKVYPYLMDHSSPEAFAFVVEADNKRIFYSGDFRSSGRKRKLYFRLLKDTPRNIDLFLTEGTMVERIYQDYPTEEAVFKAINTVIQDQENITFVISSAQNIDRLVSVYKSCKLNGKQMVLDVYNAWVLDMVKKKSPSMPIIEWVNIWVYNHFNQMQKIEGAEFDDFRARVKKKSTENHVFDNPKAYVYFLRCPNSLLVNKLMRFGKINLIYSQWKGYLEEDHKTYCTDYINELSHSEKVNFHRIHTSGHATLFDLKRLARAINPTMIVPIHTESPEKVKQAFEKDGFTNVVLWEDGIEYQL